MAGVGNELTPKFVKAHFINSSVSQANALRWSHKLIYEFWGFCVNGADSLTVPGGFAPVSGVLFPAGFQSSSAAVLLATGSDGVTVAGMPFFTAPSVNWTSASLINKWLVTWKSSSLSTDDSIYPIIQVINSSTIRLDVNAGGTAYSGTLHPSFADRTGINFRVVDFNAAVAMAGYTADADGLVLQLNGAYLVNTGQVAPQCRTRIRTSVGANLPNISFTLSASGSWTPASSSGFFTDGAAEVQPGSNWFAGGAANGTGYVTLIGAQDFLLYHLRGQWQGGGNIGCPMHIEVPQRLYPQNNDPNPVTGMNPGSNSVTTTSTTLNYGGGFSAFHPPDGTTRSWQSMIRSPFGDYFNSLPAPSNKPDNIANGRFNEAFFNVFTNKFLMFDLAMGLPGITNQYAAMRFKLRRVRWVPKLTPTNQRFGDHGEWVHINNGILWPWDNSILPYNLLFAGP